MVGIVIVGRGTLPEELLAAVGCAIAEVDETLNTELAGTVRPTPSLEE